MFEKYVMKFSVVEACQIKNCKDLPEFIRTIHTPEPTLYCVDDIKGTRDEITENHWLVKYGEHNMKVMSDFNFKHTYEKL